MSTLLVGAATGALVTGALCLAGLRGRGPWSPVALGLMAVALPGALLLPGVGGLLVLSALPLLAATHPRAGRPRSERHMLAVVVAALAAAVAGARIAFLGTSEGYLFLSLPAAIGATVLWMTAVVMVLELTSVVPFLAGIVAVAVAVGSQLLPGAYHTKEGDLLAGAILGACGARGLLGLAPGGGSSLDRTEVLVLGHAVALLTVMGVMKGATLAGVVMPSALLVLLLVLVGVGGFERSLLLRPPPRSRG